MPYDPFFKKQAARPPMDHVTMFQRRHTGPHSAILELQFRAKRKELDELRARYEAFARSTR